MILGFRWIGRMELENGLGGWDGRIDFVGGFCRSAAGCSAQGAIVDPKPGERWGKTKEQRHVCTVSFEQEKGGSDTHSSNF